MQMPMLDSHSLDIRVDLDSLAANYNAFRQLCSDAEVAGVVKADAYGLGMEPIAKQLVRYGCKTFFVAHLKEAVSLRQAGVSGDIYVLNGLLPGSEPAYRAYDVRPVLTALDQWGCWQTYCSAEGWQGKAAIYIDTGLNRLGLRLEEVGTIKHLVRRHPSLLALVMSHFACADELANPRNQEQMSRFEEVLAGFPGTPKASMAASAGSHLGRRSRFDIVRPGIGLYGGNPFADRPNPYVPVVTVQARLIQVKTYLSGEYVGYGSGCRLNRDCLLGVLSFGYADGLSRRASTEPCAVGLCCYSNRRPLPIIGRISMDLAIVDLSNVSADPPKAGSLVEICGESQSIDQLSAALGSIPNEILTRLGARCTRSYTQDISLHAAA